MAIRTDLACEAGGLSAEREGVTQNTREERGFPVTEVNITSESAAEALHKPVGKYITVGLDAILHREDESFRLAAEVIAQELKTLLRLGKTSPVLVVGLGNDGITADSIGPLTLRSTIVTRHLRDAEPEIFAPFRAVSAVQTGVTGTTGIESAELVRAAVETVRPAAVIAVDALASLSPERLCRTVQLSDTGIIPGSGVGNDRAALNEAYLGIPVIAVGVPTVIDASAFTDDEAAKGLFVTPRNIDEEVRSISKLTAYGINLALHRDITISDIEMLIE